MKRREFIGLVGGAAALPLVALAQNSGPRKVGVLFPGVLGADRERLIAEGLTSELGSEKFILIVRSAEGDDQLFAKYANELAASMDVILAIASGSLVASRQASQTVPIVALDLESDLIATGAAQSLNRPGGNVTGIFLDAPEIAGKWIQIIREILPRIRKVALPYDTHLDQTQLKSGENTARSIGIETLRLGIDQPGEFRSAFQSAVEAKVDAMLVHSSPIFVDQAAVIAELSREFRLASIGLFPIYAKVGGLISETDSPVVPDQHAYCQIVASHHSSVVVCFGRRGDRVEMPFAAVHESVAGTFAKCRPALRLSAYRGRPEVIGAQSE
jgi:putative ABC transport system substrate-binding protein